MSSAEELQRQANELLRKGGHVIFAGNPGVGKSTLLNSILQRPKFKAGFSALEGLTTVLQTAQVGNLIVSDTPGLDDVRRRRQAAREIEKALRKGGRTMLFFVMTTESGRVRPADVATAKLILQALMEKGFRMGGKYAVIINKASPQVLRDKAQFRDIIAELLSECAAPFNILFHSKVPDAEDMDNFIMAQPQRLMANMLHIPPVMIPHGTKVTIHDEKLGRLTQRVESLQEEIRRLRAERRRMENVAAPARQHAQGNVWYEYNSPYAYYNPSTHGQVYGQAPLVPYYATQVQYGGLGRANSAPVSGHWGAMVPYTPPSNRRRYSRVTSCTIL